MSNDNADQVRQFTVDDDDDGVRLDRWFKRHLPQVGFGTVSRWARTGQLRVDGKRVKPEDRLATGQIVRVPPGGDEPNRAPRARPELTPEQEAEAEAMLIVRTNSALVLNKPPGLATQGGTKTNRHVDGLLDAFAGPDEPRPRLVHRLDKDTSGVLLVARSASSAAFFSKRFASRGATKIYWALVVGVPEVHEGTIDAPLAKQPGSGGEKMHIDAENGQTAKTLYRVVERAGNAAAWVELQPFTGRTHQLRVHMAAIGHPIVGDGKYGGQDAFLTGSVSRKMHLHARRLIIEAPKGETIDVTAELPEHFAASMAQLGFDAGLSNAGPLSTPRPERNKAEKKQAAKAHAKQSRKDKPTRRGRGAAKADAKKPVGKAVRKPKPQPKPQPKSQSKPRLKPKP
jgi:23S rRNA pseudouridine955/2504/2580 synthase